MIDPEEPRAATGYMLLDDLLHIGWRLGWIMLWFVVQALTPDVALQWYEVALFAVGWLALTVAMEVQDRARRRQ